MTDKRRRVLVVEDEMLVAMMMEDMSADLGHEVVGPAMRLETALALAREADIDIAVLDINLNDVQSFPVADVLRGRGIPFVFATGYGKKGLNQTYAETITLQKPFDSGRLKKALCDVVN